MYYILIFIQHLLIIVSENVYQGEAEWKKYMQVFKKKLHTPLV